MRSEIQGRSPDSSARRSPSRRRIRTTGFLSNISTLQPSQARTKESLPSPAVASKTWGGSIRENTAFATPCDLPPPYFTRWRSLPPVKSTESDPSFGASRSRSSARPAPRERRNLRGNDMAEASSSSGNDTASGPSGKNISRGNISAPLPLPSGITAGPAMETPSPLRPALSRARRGGSR